MLTWVSTAIGALPRLPSSLFQISSRIAVDTIAFMPPPLMCAAIACTRCEERPSGSPSTTRELGFSSSITPGAITALAA